MQFLAGAGALPRTAEELRQHAAAKGARVSRDSWRRSRCGKKSSCARPARKFLRLCAKSRKARWRARGVRCSAKKRSGGSYFTYPLFLNRLLFSEDGRDDYLVRRTLRDAGKLGPRSRTAMAGCAKSSRVFCGRYMAKRSMPRRSTAWMNVPENARRAGGDGNPGRIRRRTGATGAADGVGAAAGRRARDGKRDRLLSRGAAAERICAADQCRSS